MRTLIFRLAILVVLGLAAAYAGSEPFFQRLVLGSSPSAPGGAPDLANGRTMFFAGGCASCHATPGQGDKLRLGGGLALHSPFGTFYAPNLSPHPRDGIGSWTADQFIVAMREGISPDGRHYYPSFPYTSYQRMGGKDLADLFGFLRSLPPVEGKAREHDVPFPFNIRRLLAGWKILHLDGKPFQPVAGKDAEWNRGAYLVEGPGHCAECHSPRNLVGGIESAKRFAGGPDPEDAKKTVPNITPHKEGLSGWSKGEMAEFLKTGETPGYTQAGGSMKSVIQNMGELSVSDRQAMAAYLVSLTPLENAVKKGK